MTHKDKTLFNLLKKYAKEEKIKKFPKIRCLHRKQRSISTNFLPSATGNFNLLKSGAANCEALNPDFKIKILDIGAGEKPLKEKLPENMEYTALDIDENRFPNIVADVEKKLPIKDNSYDFVICSEVLEHTLNPKKVVKELKRICKKNGFILYSYSVIYRSYGKHS